MLLLIELKIVKYEDVFFSAILTQNRNVMVGMCLSTHVWQNNPWNAEICLNCCAAYRIYLNQESSINKYLKITKIAPPLKNETTFFDIYFLHSSLAMIRAGKLV